MKICLTTKLPRDLDVNTVAAFYNGIRRKRPADSASTWQLQENTGSSNTRTVERIHVEVTGKYQKFTCAHSTSDYLRLWILEIHKRIHVEVTGKYRKFKHAHSTVL
jgi:uncharacterized ParB-like nuclease family protein